jgi:membrane protein DedA with SNARE-associated domain
MDGVFAWVAAHGYWALYLLLALGVVGLPIPDETLLVFTGYLIGRGTLHPVGAFAAAVAGAWTGISGSYLLGRTLGVGAVHRYGKYVRLTETRLAKVHMWFDRIGHWMLFVGYYIAGLRHFTAVVAGMSRVAYPTFIAYAWSGGALWVGSFLTLGYFLGENWLRVAELVHRYVGIASIAIMALAALWFAVWYALKEKKTKNPAKTKP